MKVNGGTYFYITNLQGDVTAICNASGTILAVYNYDAYGKITSMTDNSLTRANPLRYRGYYYDSETGFYYLKGRYYDPNICRFINADDAAYLGANGDFTSCNLFAYCGNNPINFFDSTGHFWQELWDELTQVVQQASGVLAFAGGVSQLDSPLPGPADIVAGAIAGVTLFACLGIATYNTLAVSVPAISIPSFEEKEIDGTDTRRLYNYWQADLVGRTVVVSAPLTLSDACLRVSMGGSVMCRNEAAAKLIIWLNGYYNYVGPEIHGECGYYPHFHPTRTHSGYDSIHIWFFE